MGVISKQNNIIKIWLSVFCSSIFRF